MDKELIRKRFSRASVTYAGQANVQRRVAREMASAIERYIPPFARRNVLEIGCGTGLFTRTYLQHAHPDRLLLNDICPEMGNSFSDILDKRIRFLAKDAETLDFPPGQDLIVSCSVVQWFDTPERFLAGCSSLLNSQGYLAFSTFGPKNMHEVASLTARSLHYLPLDELRRTLSREYRIVYSREELVGMSFASPLHVLKHLKATGVTGIGRQQWTKGMLDDFCLRYKQQYGKADGTVPLTYHPIYMICKK